MASNGVTSPKSQTGSSKSSSAFISTPSSHQGSKNGHAHLIGNISAPTVNDPLLSNCDIEDDTVSHLQSQPTSHNHQKNSQDSNNKSWDPVKNSVPPKSSSPVSLSGSVAMSLEERMEECERLRPAGNGLCGPDSYGTALQELNTMQPDSGGGVGGIVGSTELPLTSGKRPSIALQRGDTELSIEHGGAQRFLPKFLHFAFADPEVEHLYQEFYSNEKRSDFKALIIIVILVNGILLLQNIFGAAGRRQTAILLICLGLTCLLAALALRPDRRDRLSARLWAAIPFALWSVMCTQIVCDLWTFGPTINVNFIVDPSKPDEIQQQISTTAGGPGTGAIAWLLLYTYATYVVFPMRYRICCALAGTMALIHFVAVCFVTNKDDRFFQQVSFPLTFIFLLFLPFLKF